MKNRRFGICGGIGLMAVLAGCGGSSGGQSYQQLVTEYYAIDDNAPTGGLIGVASRVNATPASSLPTSQSITYDGVAYIPVTSTAEGTVELLSDMVLIADFGASTVRGDLTNFVTSAEEQFTGSMEIEESPIDRDADLVTELTYVADLNGSIVSSAGVVYQSDAYIAGEFAGGTEFIRGYVRGDLLIDGERIEIFDPEFLGEAR